MATALECGDVWIGPDVERLQGPLRYIITLIEYAMEDDAYEKDSKLRAAMGTAQGCIDFINGE